MSSVIQWSLFRNITTKKIILFGILFTLLIVSVKAQEKILQSSLMGKIWVLRIEGKSYYATLKFTNSDEINTFITSSGKAVTTNQYYLSDSIDTIFQSAKVGQNKTGKYLIAKRTVKPTTKSASKIAGVHIRKLKDTTYKDMIIYEILDVSNNMLKMKSIDGDAVYIYKIE